MSWRVTLPCTRAEGEAVGEMDDPFPDHPHAPVIVADEPDERRPNDWLIHAYFEQEPGEAELAVLRGLASGAPVVSRLEEEDWITLSQAGLEPIRAGRFYVHTAAHEPDAGAINFLIDAGLAFGTGQHATTHGCLLALDGLAGSGERFTNIADIGTGTGLLAFAALALWPDAPGIATDIDPVAIDVTRENARLNGVALGERPGELALAVADGMADPALSARAPFDLILANILAGPLIALAPDFAPALERNGRLILAGLLDTQADAVLAAYAPHGLRLHERLGGEWPVLVLGRD